MTPGKMLKVVRHLNAVKFILDSEKEYGWLNRQISIQIDKLFKGNVLSKHKQKRIDGEVKVKEVKVKKELVKADRILEDSFKENGV